MRIRFLPLLFALAVLVGLLCPSCLTSGSGGPPKLVDLEQLDEATYERLESDAISRIDTYLGLAYEHGVVDDGDLQAIAGVLDAIAAGRIQPIPGGPLSDTLADQGFSEREVRAAFQAVNDVLDVFGVNPAIEVGPRNAQFLRALAVAVLAIRPADPATEA